MGGKVPTSYYLSNNLPVAKDYMVTITIGAGGKKKMKYDVHIARSTLKYTHIIYTIFNSSEKVRISILCRWEFVTEGGDIKY